MSPPSPSSSLSDTCAPSSLSLTSSSSSLTPLLPPGLDLGGLLTDTRLTLDLYPGGAGLLVQLWGSVPEQLGRLQYLRLGSEDEPGLGGALQVLPHLTELRFLSIRGESLPLPSSPTDCCHCLQGP